MRFDGKTAVITGASRGIGKAVAERLAAEGAQVLLTARAAEALDAAVADISAAGRPAIGLVADMADPVAVEHIVTTVLERFGGLDVLINNAGIDHEAPFLDTAKHDWDRVLAVNLTGPFLLGQAAAREMVKSGGGSIVNITSVAGHAVDGLNAGYCVTKAGLIALTRSIAVEMAPFGVRCNSISPGYTATDMVLGAEPFASLGGEPFRRAPQRRLLDPDEIAAACVFLASDEASAITGSDLIVDGGLMADLYALASLERA